MIQNSYEKEGWNTRRCPRAPGAGAWFAESRPNPQGGILRFPRHWKEVGWVKTYIKMEGETRGGAGQPVEAHTKQGQTGGASAGEEGIRGLEGGGSHSAAMANTVEGTVVMPRPLSTGMGLKKDP